MSQIVNWANLPGTAVRQRCIEAVLTCARKLPQPYNFNSSVGHYFRRKRLENELLEFSFRYRLAHGNSASIEQLICIGELLIESCKGTLPANPIPLDGDWLINRQTLPFLVRWMEERLDKTANSMME